MGPRFELGLAVELSKRFLDSYVNVKIDKFAFINVCFSLRVGRDPNNLLLLYWLSPQHHKRSYVTFPEGQLIVLFFHH